jgi:hypothetical protein
MKHWIVAIALLGFAFALPGFAAKAERPTVVYGAAAGSSMTLKEYEAKNKQRSAQGKPAAAAPAKPAAPGETKKKVAKKSGAN